MDKDFVSEEKIRNNPSLKKLREEAEQFRRLVKAWPKLKPLAWLLGANTVSIDDQLKQALRLAKQVDDLTAVPDKFNSIFSDGGWVLFDSMELEVAQRAIEIAEEDDFDKADEFLVAWFSPDWVDKHLHQLENLRGFRERFGLAKLALEDYRKGRFYASTLVVLSLIDGWVSELNMIDFHRHGFFSEMSQLVAWDSIAAHPKGLVKLQRAFGKSRMATRTKEIRIPYRHGIVHGMDLGYNNKYVAAKCWAALFAVRDWALKVSKGELNPPELEPGVEKTLWESIESFLEIREETKRLNQWQPRRVIVGESIPRTGKSEDYLLDTPERKTVEFMDFWLRNNYGYMARCCAPLLQMTPVDVRNKFQNLRLAEFELVGVNDATPSVTDVQVKVKMETKGDVSSAIYEFRLVVSNAQGDLAYIQGDDTVWGIMTWRVVQ